MHDDMVKILELFIKPKTFFNTQIGQIIQVNSTKVKEIVLKIFYSCYSTEGLHTDLKQKEITEK
jgi:hypothetical protein